MLIRTYVKCMCVILVIIVYVEHLDAVSEENLNNTATVICNLDDSNNA